MLATLRKRSEREDEGFTLIELMVVVLIIAILLAIAIPTFLGAQNRARDRSAQSNLRNAVTAAKTIATDAEGQFENDSNTVIAAADLTAVEGAIDFDDGDATDTGRVGLTVATSTAIVLNAESASDTWFCMSAQSTGEVGYGSGDASTDVDALTECGDDEF